MVDKTALSDPKNVQMELVPDDDGPKAWTAAQRDAVLGGGDLPPVVPKKSGAP